MKPPIIVAVEVDFEKGSLDSVKDVLRTMEEETNKEPGCITYAFSIDINNPTKMRIYEVWESMEALQAHFVAPHMADFRSALDKVQPKSMDVKVYEIGKEIDISSLQ
jgi:quinol monooxygenase YgiN